jgi:hypothetical protein
VLYVLTTTTRTDAIHKRDMTLIRYLVASLDDP